jgi:hypothetical protein
VECIADFIRNGTEQVGVFNCFAIGDDPDIIRLAAKFGKTRSLW